MTVSTLRSALLLCIPALAASVPHAVIPQDDPAPATQEKEKPKAVRVQYLEIVTPDVDATCRVLEKMHGVKFSERVPEFANARTAPLAGGGKIGVRAPGRPDEEPVVRPYVLVEDIDAAFAVAKEAETEVMMAPMEIPKVCKFAIYGQGGIQHGLWQD